MVSGLQPLSLKKCVGVLHKSPPKKKHQGARMQNLISNAVIPAFFNCSYVRCLIDKRLYIVCANEGDILENGVASKGYYVTKIKKEYKGFGDVKFINSNAFIALFRSENFDMENIKKPPKNKQYLRESFKGQELYVNIKNGKIFKMIKQNAGAQGEIEANIIQNIKGKMFFYNVIRSNDYKVMYFDKKTNNYKNSNGDFVVNADDLFHRKKVKLRKDEAALFERVLV